jgi:uncharacterized protein (TIGR03067 family)
MGLAVAQKIITPELAAIAEQGGEGVYHLDPTKSPKTIDIVTLGGARKTALGLYQLDGDTLKLCLSLDPAKVSERPKEFGSREGESRVVVTLKRVPEAELPGSPKGTYALPKGTDGTGWAIALDGAGKFSMTRNGQLLVGGRYRISGDVVEFTDDEGPAREKGDRQTGTYRWRLAGQALLFTHVKDEAPGRLGTLTRGAWVKVPDPVPSPAPKP